MDLKSISGVDGAVKIFLRIKRGLIKRAFSVYSILTGAKATKVLGGRTVELPYARFGELRAIKKFPNKEREFYEQMKKSFAECDVLVDVGANIGLYMMEFAGSLGIEVIGYEPDAHNFERCTENIDRYPVKGIVCKNDAVGSFCGEVSMEPSKSGSGSSRVASLEIGLSVPRSVVRQITLDDVLASIGTDRNVAILIDVEGGEVELIEGWDRNWDNIRCIAIEMHQRALKKKGKDLSWLMSEMQDRGYRCEWMQVPEPPRPQHWETHAIFLRASNE